MITLGTARIGRKMLANPRDIEEVASGFSTQPSNQLSTREFDRDAETVSRCSEKLPSNRRKSGARRDCSSSGGSAVTAEGGVILGRVGDGGGTRAPGVGPGGVVIGGVGDGGGTGAPGVGLVDTGASAASGAGSVRLGKAIAG
jgi:hypothetical protein